MMNSMSGYNSSSNSKEVQPSRNNSVYRKNNQKRRAPSFRAAPCEREMLKSMKSKRSPIYASNPELSQGSNSPRPYLRSSHRTSVKKMVETFELVSSDERKPVTSSKITEFSISSQPYHPGKLPSRSSSVRSTCHNSSFDAGCQSDFGCLDSDLSNSRPDRRTSYESSTSLCLLPATLPSARSHYHQDNPLYGSLPRPRMRTSVLKQTKFPDKSPVSFVKRTHSTNSDIAKEHFIQRNMNGVVNEDSDSSLCHTSDVVTNSVEHDKLASVNEPQKEIAECVSSFKSAVNSPISKSSSVQERRTSGTYVARWVHVDDL